VPVIKAKNPQNTNSILVLFGLGAQIWL
jgi:hypothetical protein